MVHQVGHNQSGRSHDTLKSDQAITYFKFPKTGHFADFKDIRLFEHTKLGATMIIAVHDTTLGPGLGGLRNWPYQNQFQAIRVVLGLAETMTLKSALARTGLGGGKSVLFTTKPCDRNELLGFAGNAVESMGGDYIVAEDSGTSPADMAVLRNYTQHVAGAGQWDPSPHTARGVYLGIKEALRFKVGSASLDGVRIALKGIGNVGRELGRLLVNDGAKIWAADVNQGAQDRFMALVGTRTSQVKFVPFGEIHRQEVEVFAPCALGQSISQELVPELKCQIVAGAENNPLDHPRTEVLLAERKILYAPDFALNAGGIIICGAEVHSRDLTFVEQQVNNIPNTIRRIFKRAETFGELPGDVARSLAKEVILNEKNKY